jgi:hypothetical protein
MTAVLDKIRHHAKELDHHWCELESAGLDLNRALAATAPDLPVQLMFLKERHARFMRGSHGAAELSLDATLLMESINPHPKGRKTNG